MKKKIFENGLVLLYEKNKVSEIDSFQVNILTGSALEKKNELGINHLVEHLMFKASNKRTTREISEELEKQGAIINAWTNYDNVRFYFKCLPEKLDSCVEIYADMLFNKNISDKEFETEKDVVCQEIKMYEDDFATKNETNYFEQFWQMKDIAGTVNSVKSLTKKQVMTFIKKRYVPANMVISVCSKLSFRKICSIIKKYFSINASNDFIDLRKEWVKFKLTHNKSITTFKKKEKTAQVQIIHGGRFTTNASPILQDFCLALISGGLSSVLFREIREKYGLCYGINARSLTFHPTKFNQNGEVGFVLIQSSMEKQNVKIYLKLLLNVLSNLGNLIQDSDVERAVNNFKTQGYKSSVIAADSFFRYLNPQIKWYKKNYVSEVKYLLKNRDIFKTELIKAINNIHWDIAILGNI